MERDKYKLEWQTFQSHSVQLNKDLFGDSELSDVTLVSDDLVKTPAHKIILGAASTVLKELCQACPKGMQQILFLRGVKQVDLEAILKFIYLGEAEVYEDRMRDFTKLVKDLNITKLNEFQYLDEDDSRKETKQKKSPHKNEGLNTIYEEKKEGRKEDSLSELVSEDKESLDNHLKTSVVTDMKKDLNISQSCKLCNYVTKKRINLTQHVKNKHKINMNKYKNEIISRKEELEEEEETSRSKENMFSRDDDVDNEDIGKETAGNLYDSFAEEASDLMQNIEKDIMEVDEDVIVENLNKASKVRIKTNEEEVQMKAEDFLQTGQCLKCHKSFSTKESMAEHFRTIYPSEKYHCPDQSCDEKFDEKESMKTHVNMCHKEIKYKCTICNIEFSKENVLRNHNKRKHSSM